MRYNYRSYNTSTYNGHKPTNLFRSFTFVYNIGSVVLASSVYTAKTVIGTLYTAKAVVGTLFTKKTITGTKWTAVSPSNPSARS